MFEVVWTLGRISADKRTHRHAACADQCTLCAECMWMSDDFPTDGHAHEHRREQCSAIDAPMVMQWLNHVSHCVVHGIVATHVCPCIALGSEHMSAECGPIANLSNGRMGKHAVRKHTSVASVVKKPSSVVKASPKPHRDGSVQQTRHKDIIIYLKQELADWVQSLEGDRSCSRGVFECALCGRVCGRKANMQRHVMTHTSGKMASMIGNLESGKQCRHPAFMQVIRALHDNDRLVGDTQGNYMARARALFAEWLSFATCASDTGSIFKALGPLDVCVALVFTADGPQFWKRTDDRLREARSFGNNRFYTRGFANCYLQHLLQVGGVYHQALRAMRTAWHKGGCEVTQLMNRQTESIANLSCELMESGAMAEFRQQSIQRLIRIGEYRSISIESTYKLASLP